MVDATSEFCSLVRFRLGEHRILMGAEIDACKVAEGRKPQEAGLDSFVEIKSYK